MLSRDMHPDYRNGFSNWLSEEWERCAAMTSAFENHAIMFLTTTNGGGAAAIIAFAGSAGYAANLVYFTLSCFVAGILLTGVTIIIGYYRLSYITRSLGKDHRAFNLNEITSGNVYSNHDSRFNSFDWALLCAWFSFAALIFGMVLGGVTYFNFQEFKTAKEQQEKIKPTSDNVVNVSCVAPSPLKGHTERVTQIEKQSKRAQSPKG